MKTNYDQVTELLTQLNLNFDDFYSIYLTKNSIQLSANFNTELSKILINNDFESRVSCNTGVLNFTKNNLTITLL
jgi:hypothetical protein